MRVSLDFTFECGITTKTSVIKYVKVELVVIQGKQGRIIPILVMENNVNTPKVKVFGIRNRSNITASKVTPTFTSTPVALLTQSATIIKNAHTTPLGPSALKPSASSTGRKHRLGLDPNWKESVKRRRILLQAELQETKANDTASPVKQWEALQEDVAVRLDTAKSDSPDSIEAISARIQLKKTQLEREEKHKAYVDNLKESIEQWKAGCITALGDLAASVPNPPTTIEMLKIFNIPLDLLNYSEESESFE